VVLLNLSFTNKKPGIIQMAVSAGPLLPILGNRKCDLISADDEQPLCVCANDHGLFLWDRENMQLIPVSQNQAWGLAVHNPARSAKNPDPRFLCALALAAGEVRVWDLTDWEVPPGLDTSKRKRVPRSYETKEDQEKEYEDRRIRKLQADHADALEKIKRKEEKTKKRRGVRRDGNDEVPVVEDDDDDDDEGDDSSSSSASSSSDVSSTDEGDDSEDNDQEEPPAKQRKSVPSVQQDKAEGASEPKWTAYYNAAACEGGLVPTQVPALAPKGFSKTELQKAIVF